MRKSVKDIHSKTIKELEKDIIALHRDIAKTTLDISVQPVKDTNLIKKKTARTGKNIDNFKQQKTGEKIRIRI